MKEWKDTYQNLVMFTQFGISCVTPLLMCLIFCWWLTDHQGMAGWVYLPGIVLGLGGTAMVGYKLYLSVMGSDNVKKNQKVSYNRHL